MVRQNISTTGAWIHTEWNCAFLMHWPDMLSMARRTLQTFETPEVLAGNAGESPKRVNPNDGSNIEEAEKLVMRGFSKILKGNISIAFNTNTNVVRLSVSRNTGLPVDYMSLSKAFGCFMDSVELYMYSAQMYNKTAILERQLKKYKSMLDAK